MPGRFLKNSKILKFVSSENALSPVLSSPHGGYYRGVSILSGLRV